VWSSALGPPGVVGYENICSMQDIPSIDPRDQVIRAALRDVAALAAIVAGEFHATYVGPDRAGYLHVLGDYLADLGGQIEQGPMGPEVAVDGRRIAIRFGASRGHR
jgi:hypothetical protein